MPKAEDVAAEERARTVPPEAKPPETPAEQPAEKPKEDRLARMRAAQEKKGLAAKPTERTPEIPPETDVGGRHAVFTRDKEGKASLRLFKTAKEASAAVKAAKKADMEVHAGSTPKDMRYDTLQEGMNRIYAEAGVKPEDVATEFVGENPVAANREQSERTAAETRAIQAEKEKAGEAGCRPQNLLLIPSSGKSGIRWSRRRRVNRRPSKRRCGQRSAFRAGIRDLAQAGKPKGGTQKRKPLRLTPEDVPLERQDVQPKTEAAAEKAIKGRTRGQAEGGRLRAVRRAKTRQVGRTRQGRRRCGQRPELRTAGAGRSETRQHLGTGGKSCR